jgi:hypothetical protein
MKKQLLSITLLSTMVFSTSVANPALVAAAAFVGGGIGTVANVVNGMGERFAEANAVAAESFAQAAQEATQEVAEENAEYIASETARLAALQTEENARQAALDVSSTLIDKLAGLYAKLSTVTMPTFSMPKIDVQGLTDSSVAFVKDHKYTIAGTTVGLGALYAGYKYYTKRQATLSTERALVAENTHRKALKETHDRKNAVALQRKLERRAALQG